MIDVLFTDRIPTYRILTYPLNRINIKDNPYTPELLHKINPIPDLPECLLDFSKLSTVAGNFQKKRHQELIPYFGNDGLSRSKNFNSANSRPDGLSKLCCACMTHLAVGMLDCNFDES